MQPHSIQKPGLPEGRPGKYLELSFQIDLGFLAEYVAAVAGECQLDLLAHGQLGNLCAGHSAREHHLRVLLEYRLQTSLDEKSDNGDDNRQDKGFGSCECSQSRSIFSAVILGGKQINKCHF